MTTIQAPTLDVLKKVLEERFVPHLPRLLGNGSREDIPKKQLSRAYCAFSLQALFGLNNESASAAVVDDFQDKGIDAIYYHSTDRTLYLVQGKYKADKPTEQFKQAEAQSFIDGVKLLINKQFEEFNDNVKSLQSVIERALDSCDHIKLVITYIGDGITGEADKTIKRAIQAEIDDGEEQLQTEAIIFGPQEVESALREEQATKLVNEKLRIHKYRSCAGSHRGYFGTVKLTDLISLHKKYGRALYEKNIRYLIGTGGLGVSRAIKGTLLNNPESFFHLNNGITIVGNSIKQRSKAKENKTTRDFEVLGLSVVNGAQTISSAAQFMEENPDANISNAQVMVTLICTANGQFHKPVTKARNLQNPVSLANFASLDDLQERLRQDMKMHDYEYRYRPEATKPVDDKIIEIDELSRALACLHTDIRYPARLKDNPALFVQADSHEYQTIFTDSLNAYHAINSVVVFRIIREVLRGAELSSPSPDRLIYRHGFYAVACILMKRMKNKITGASLLDPQTVRSDISAPLDTLRQKCFDELLDSRAPHSFFRELDETASYINKVIIEHESLNTDPAVENLLRVQDSHDPYNQRLSHYLANKLEQI